MSRRLALITKPHSFPWKKPTSLSFLFCFHDPMTKFDSNSNNNPKHTIFDTIGNKDGI